MTEAVIRKLNQVNQEFYTIVSEYFDRTRQYSWEGWDQLIKFLKTEKKEIHTVLDIGCGNGRFYQYLVENGYKVQYTGIDANEYLLEKARNSFPKGTWLKGDILNDLAIEDQHYDLIVSFGVMHHIPSYAKRQNLVKEYSSLLTDEGVLCLSFWNFLDDARIAKKQVNWDEIGLSENDVEEHDYLLTWDRGARAIRYCHYYSDYEIDKLTSSAHLVAKQKYKAEGKDGLLNTYLITQKQKTRLGTPYISSMRDWYW